MHQLVSQWFEDSRTEETELLWAFGSPLPVPDLDILPFT